MIEFKILNFEGFMEFIVIPLVALGASLLTFYSGFGLGTILTPVFALFFPVELSVALTAIVHFLNNIFKYSLIGRHAEKNIVIKFGLPAAISALIGAWILGNLSDIHPIMVYHLSGRRFEVLPIKLIIAILVIFFTLFEIIPFLSQLQFSKRYLSLGGVLSGFFGGVSGHQGALRSAFLAKAGLSKEQFIATGNAIALMIDIPRISIYYSHMKTDHINSNLSLLFLVTLAAFIGAYLGNKFLKKITLQKLKLFVTVSLIILSVALGLGFI